MKDATTVVVLGGSFCQMLFLVFLIMKLMGVITWSWWLVTAPLWAPTVFVLAIVWIVFSLAIFALGIIWAVERHKKSRRG